MDATVLEKLRIPWLRKIRLVSTLLAICHISLVAVALVVSVYAARACITEAVVASSITAAASSIRLVWMLGTGLTQAAVASTMISEEHDLVSSHTKNTGQLAQTRKQRRLWYKRLIWWGRFGLVVSLLQLIGAALLTYFLVKTVTSTAKPYGSCYPGADDKWEQQHHLLVLALAIVAWVLSIMQCCAGSDVLAWSLLYSWHDDAWRAYYREMFDYGIREALCCLGRFQYMSTPGEDEVDSVAALLGDLVSYRAAGASHLEFLAGLTLLQLQRQVPLCTDEFPEAPESLIRESTILHPYAVAAYTGPLLDVGRNPLTFLCVWIYRQGVLTLWKRNRRPSLQGDNWWRGHASAFLKHLQLPPEALRKGRVYQAKREAAYFVTIIHHLQCVVVTIRGTETPEDLLTDGLGRECPLLESDLHGLLRSEHLPERIKEKVASTMPHFGHEGIIEAARELAMQLDNGVDSTNRDASSSTSITALGGDTLLERKGLLSSLLGPGGECEGYALRFVGHSLGGSIAALTAMLLYSQYPNLHVFGYGILPCVDAVIADACSGFVTSIVYNDEFSSRLSVSSLFRLRESALKTLASGSSSNSLMISKVAQRILGSERHPSLKENDGMHQLEFTKEISVSQKSSNLRRKHRHYKYKLKGSDNCEESEGLVMDEERGVGPTSDLSHYLIKEDIHENDTSIQELDQNGFGDKMVDLRPETRATEVDYVEMFMPGLIIHLVPASPESGWPLFKGWTLRRGKKYQHKAILRDKESFRDIIVSPSMFLDHMPWRCQYALNSIVENMLSNTKDSDLVIENTV